MAYFGVSGALSVGSGLIANSSPGIRSCPGGHLPEMTKIMVKFKVDFVYFKVHFFTLDLDLAKPEKWRSEIKKLRT